MNKLSKTRRNLLILVSSPLFLICLALSLIATILSPVIIFIGSLMSLIDWIKNEDDILETFGRFLLMWCGIGMCIYFEIVWDKDILE